LARHAKARLQDRLDGRIALRAMHETPIHLELIERNVAQLRERRVAVAEVVDRQADAFQAQARATKSGNSSDAIQARAACGALLCKPPSGSALRHTADRKKRFRRNICAVWPTHRSTRDEELAKLRAISKGIKHRPVKPTREVNGLSKTGIEDKLYTVTRNVPGFGNLRQNFHGCHSNGAIWRRG
jgi:hypothetical protein